ncbi:hypothetical protein, partial [Undibacterium sp.]|uniref:hypothetical protein n=1 Tax=Undibacterium sp. TaxID=1914977 RepID=UPI00374FF0DB
MKILGIKALMGLVASLFVLLVSTEVLAQDRHGHRNYSSHAPDRRAYQHIYYPNHQAYFSPHSNTWSWREGGRWHTDYRLPSGIDIRIGGIPIQLISTVPYYEQRYVETHYPRTSYVVRPP